MQSTRIRREFESLTSQPLEDYFQITSGKLEISAVDSSLPNLNTLDLEINYKDIPRYLDFGDLPHEVSEIINSYRENFIKIQIRILFPRNYPLRGSSFLLKNVDSNVNAPIDLKEYYKYRIKSFNKSWKRDYSPAMKIEHYVLDFIQTINHFEHFV